MPDVSFEDAVHLLSKIDPTQRNTAILSENLSIPLQEAEAVCAQIANVAARELAEELAICDEDETVNPQDIMAAMMLTCFYMGAKLRDVMLTGSAE